MLILFDLKRGGDEASFAPEENDDRHDTNSGREWR